MCGGSTAWGSVIQVMLCPRSYGIVGRNTQVITEAAERYGRERSVSSMWCEALQANWSSANWAAEPSLQGVWSPICPPGRQAGDGRRAAHPRGTLARREDFPPW